MSRWTLLLLCCFGWPGSVFAQAPVSDTLLTAWKHNLVGSVALSQVGFKDWAQGGQSALAWTLIVEGKSAHDHPSTDWTTSYKTAFGQTRQGDQGFRKTDDKLDLETMLTYKLGTYVNPFVATTLKTQFAQGFKYDAAGVGTAVSQFFDPAYLTQSTGVGYQPFSQFKTRLGIALRETITRRFNNFADDPQTPALEKTRVEGGLESVTNLEWQLAENIFFNGKFEVFLPLETLDDLIVRSDTTLTMKVNRYIATNINMQLLKDTRSSPHTQIKEALSIGLSYTVF